MANWREAEIDGRGSTSWSEQWENAEGDVVSYGYTYRSALGQKIDQNNKEPTGPLHVTINYFRAELVRSMAAEIDLERKKIPPTQQAPPCEPPAQRPGTSVPESGTSPARTIGPVLQFETYGVEFGPWVRHFVAQIRRNWPRPTIKDAAQVVIAFDVDKHGTLSNIEIVGKAETDALNQAATNALRASNPTAPLPTAYPKGLIRITATFDYNPIQQRAK